MRFSRILVSSYALASAFLATVVMLVPSGKMTLGMAVLVAALVAGWSSSWSP